MKLACDNGVPYENTPGFDCFSTVSNLVTLCLATHKSYLKQEFHFIVFGSGTFDIAVVL